ncbi:D-alanyl-D-alanine carboxypeptidase [Bdellovibrio sp. KM01]|uniref:D-alanyl-D-alanine carboxypeptidase n=1 Tax=Bdellovibrio sp. KM01 TaxID=2748865 RepID=UPI001C68667C|nr:D-alanyl-D-alanine carboxypeptidase [Bdellovibrio sp. KM01]
MVSFLRFQLALTALIVGFTTSSAYAKVYLNSQCTMKANSGKIEGNGSKDEKFPLASISKLVTSLWAIETLGANYRFETKIHVTKVGPKAYNMHFEGSRDPLMGRNVGYFILAQLTMKQLGIERVENLTFDENFQMEWNVEEPVAVAGDTKLFTDIAEQAAHVQHELENGFITPIADNSYTYLRKISKSVGVTLPQEKPRINFGSVSFLAKADFKKANDTQTFVYKSAPLYKIVKNMNNKSNNYVADHLYWNLGGTPAFNAYLAENLKMDNRDLEFNLGSGNNADYISKKKYDYNEGTCTAMIKVLIRLNEVLATQKLVLTDVMAVAGKDSESTLVRYDGVMGDAMTAKTGTVDKAKTLAGTISTGNGTIYFVILMHKDSSGENGSAANAIKNRIRALFTINNGSKKINYSETTPLPFDSQSALVLGYGPHLGMF